jgi:hypothetical protein
MFKYITRKSLQRIIIIAIIAMSAAVFAGNMDVSAEEGTFQVHLPFELSPHGRWIGAPEAAMTAARADHAGKETFQVYLPFELSPYDRWIGAPEEIVTVARAGGTDNSVHRYDLLPEHIRDQILIDNMNRRIASGVFYDATGRHLWPLPSEEAVVATDPSAFRDDACNSC